MKSSRSIRRGLALVFLLGFAGPSALMSGCAGTDDGVQASAGAAGTAPVEAPCPLPASAELPARCVACIHDRCPTVYAHLCAANCGEAELEAPCLNAQKEIPSCIAMGCGIDCAMTHGSQVPGSIGGMGNAGGSSHTDVGGSEVSAGAVGSAGAAGDRGEAGTAGSDESAGGAAGSSGASDQCAGAIRLSCGDRFNHSTLIQGRPNTWSSYSSTQRGETGRETLYAFSNPSQCEVVARLKNLDTDLDLLLAPYCDSISSTKASSTPIDIQTEETLTWNNVPGDVSYVVVDGYAKSEGSYTLEVDCTCVQ